MGKEKLMFGQWMKAANLCMKWMVWNNNKSNYLRSLVVWFLSLNLVTTENASGMNPDTNLNPGLKNFAELRYTCFVNATLQCLSHLESLNNFLMQNKEALKGSLWEQYDNIIKEMAKTTGTYIGHKAFAEIMAQKSYFGPADVITHLFNKVPDNLKDEMLKLAFVQEKRTYTINDDAKKTKQIYNFKYIHNQNQSFTTQTSILPHIWTISEDNLAQNKFVRDDEPGYEFSGEEPLFIDYIKESCSKKINLDLDKIKENLKNDAAIFSSFLSQNERDLLLSMPKMQQVSLERKLIPPEILILGGDQIHLSSLNPTMLIEKKYLDNGINSNINYELKSFAVQGQTQYNTGHTWAYAKNKSDEWIEYDDDKVKKIGHFPNDADMESLCYTIQYQPAFKIKTSICISCYELDAASKKVMESYYKKSVFQEKLLTLKEELVSLKTKLDGLRTKLEAINTKLNEKI